MKKSYVYLLLCSLLSFSVWSQENQIKGVVTDQTGVPLPGASIVEQGTPNGVVSDFDGQFSLTPSKNQIVLEISYVGYKTLEVSARA
ncbi:MAG: hypothetical protein DSY83_09670, partial [Flavobacteriia bacterium]